MARNNADFAAGLFHGTTAAFNPGDIIAPRASTGASASFEDQPQMEQFNPDHVAYAIDNQAAATYYANKRAKKEGGKGKVYHVTPVNAKDVEVDPNGGGTTTTAYQSKSGFRVVKQVK
jgi:hypothetical protein